ncbi:ABC transporter ATP-binding protein [Variovorax sp. M-6]|uniref:ABC transporter ATP-binding protein n=1 Tax=Variovorax sp. M-6 TaxID=3233041 RepID=UPI003F965DFE
MPLLDIQGLHAGYGASDVLHDVAIAMEPGSFHALIGANGAGKSTTMKALSGLLRPVRGSIAFAGEDIARLPAARIVSKGFALVPEGRRVFGPLSVKDNLQMGAFTDLFPRRKSNLEDRLAFVLSTFPRLEERLSQAAGTLSGGEQQMLAIGRALMSGPRLLALDEPSMGLAPVIVEQVFAALKQLQRGGLTILVSEQNASITLAHADIGHVMESGAITLSGAAAALRDDDRVREAYLGL